MIFPTTEPVKYVLKAEHQTAQELGRRLLTLAERQDDPAFRLEAQVGLGGGHFFLGQFEAAMARLQAAQALVQAHPIGF